MAILQMAALGAFIYQRIRAGHDFDVLSRTCSPGCNAAEIEGVKREYVVSYVFLGMAGAALATAGVTLWLAPTRADAPLTAVGVAWNGSGVSLRGQF